MSIHLKPLDLGFPLPKVAWSAANGDDALRAAFRPVYREQRDTALQTRDQVHRLATLSNRRGRLAAGCLLLGIEITRLREKGLRHDAFLAAVEETLASDG